MSQLLVLSLNRMAIISKGSGACAHARTRLRPCAAASNGIEGPGDAHALNRVALGHVAADAALRGGLASGAMHEVFAEGRQSGAATGLVAGFAGRLSPRRPLVWVRQDFCEIESGALSMSGLSELGLDPRLVVSVHAADVDTRCAARPMRSSATRWARWCWKSGARRDSSIWSPAAS